MATDYRRANYLPLSVDRTQMDYLKAAYANLKYALVTVKTIVISDAFSANLPGLAYQELGDVGLWWALGLYNGLVDPISDLPTGTIINIFSVTDFLSFIQAVTQANTTGSSAASTQVVTL